MHWYLYLTLLNDISYTEWISISDKPLIQTIGEFLQHHRLHQNKSQSKVAEAANISRSTLSLLVRREKIALNSLLKVLRILNLLFIMNAFKVKDEISPIAYAKLQKKKRQRAGKKSKKLNNG